MTALKPEDDFDPRAGDQAVCIYAPYQMALFFGDRYIGKRCRLLTDFSVQPEGRSDGIALCKIRFEDRYEFWASREMLGRASVPSTWRILWKQIVRWLE